MEIASSISMCSQKLEPFQHIDTSEDDDDTNWLLVRTSQLLLVADSPQPVVEPPKPRTTINSLPNELLDVIFKITHADWLLFTLHPELYSSQPSTLRKRSWKGLMKLFCQFPYTPAAVCRRWRNIVHDTARFWTRPVVFVDSRDPLASLSNLKNFIQRSKGHPLILAVVRKDYNVVQDLQEGMNVSLFMDVILANLNRFNDIYFHLHHSSSLPSIAQFRYQPPFQPNLARLALHCDEDDGPNHDTTIPKFLVATHWPPSLVTLKIDGRNFGTIAKEPYTWSLVLSHLKTLSIERLDQPAHSTHEPLSLLESLEFLARLPELEVLTIRDVAFETSTRVPGTAPIVINVTDLILEDLSADVAKHMFDLAIFNPTYLLLRNIPIDALPHVPQPIFLELSEIPIDQDIEDFLCFWDGEVLALRDCPGFNDAILALFAEEVSPPYHICPSLRELHVQNCSNFSGRGLRRMAEIRMDFASRRENESLNLSHISDIFVSGMGPILAPEDALWMRTHLKTFVWSTVQPSGGSCHLDPSAVVPFTIP
ncbi:hypothetical protein CC1G_09501 [Coprinopsis cinerea okayama7|uniref:F-box domain-containing protein n=1 Tax=Coprinopsis cinerea (strain Okayama-7 / 130 / ATCC MYA-4618 / FGSC 9003) TaxID=240176 RepID=A8P0R9_COPC7|nr:hypothetical protein CC1G_09501 [Coprinopsis cinerea okayama7\|eukprot:XP_001837950.1 hypothetical protein CC1G_09501 [Coprinopsis cinerea okayama7\